jgi:hypothetical protein
MPPTGSESANYVAAAREAQCENGACAAWFRVPAKLIGHVVRCPHCGSEMRADGALARHELPALKRLCQVTIRSGPAFIDREFDLDPQRSYTLGRSDDCEIQIPSNRVSRRHASLHWVNKRWVLEDLNSTHGTEVNGLRISKHELSDGERIGVGEYELVFGLPRRSLKPGQALLDAQAVQSADPPLYIESHSTSVDDKVKAAQHTILAATASFETNKDVQKVYRQAARDVRIRQALWAVGALVAVAVVLWSLGVFRSSKPKSGASAARPTSAPGAAIPPAFQAAVLEKRFADAAAEIENLRASAPSSDALRRMTSLYDTELTAWNATLQKRALSAAKAGDWKVVGETLKTASDPTLARFAGVWTSIRDQYETAELTAKLTKLRAADDFDTAFAMIEEQRARVESLPELVELVAAIREDARCGLRVEAQPAGANASVVVDKDGPRRCGGTIWKLHPGKRDLHVSAPGFRSATATVELEPGTVRVAEFRLAAAASGPLWTLQALRAAKRPAAIWAAARYFAQTPASGLRYTRAELAALEQPARRGVDSSPPRIATLTLKDGVTLLGQVWNQPGFVSVRELPKGDKRTIKVEDVLKTEDVPAGRAARLLADAIYTEQQNDDGPAAALNALAVLMLQFGDDASVSGEIMPFVRQCVEQLEQACGGCCGAGMTACPDCDARGSISGEVVCPGCKGTREIPCVTCRGSGNELCRLCGGSGKTTVQVRSGIWVRDSYRKCTGCAGTGKQRCTDCPGARGKIECRRCKATGKISGKGECPTCTGAKTVRCPACGGEKTRDDMLPEARDAAEADALAAAKPSQP